MDVPGRITHLDQLTDKYHEPGPGVREKVLTAINEAMADFIDRCRLVVLATTDGIGNVDASPRGGPPGFVQRLDDRHVAIPDLNGNNRLDSLRNVIAHPWAGLLMMVPGQDETVRINGPAVLSDDPALLSGFTAELRTPKLALVVETAEIYGHYAKAFRRAGAWSPDSWELGDGTPDLAAMYACHWNLDEGVVRSGLQTSYADDLARD